MEAMLYEHGAFPFTPEWYEGREHAPHREQPPHWARMDEATRFVVLAASLYGVRSVVDIGAGDGGLLSSVRQFAPELDLWGYDIMEPNVMHARMSRHIDVRLADFLTDDIEWGDLVLCTEVLEHLEDPHAMVRRMASSARFIVASSPASETAENHTPEHAWCWDQEGYLNLLQGNGFKLILEHTVVNNGDMDFQVVLARKPS